LTFLRLPAIFIAIKWGCKKWGCKASAINV